MTRSSSLSMLAGFLSLFVPSVALSQYGTAPEGAISGTGFVEIKRPAQLLRMKVQLIAKGKDLKDALAKLADRRTAAVKHVTELGAVAESIQLSEPEMQAVDENARRQMEMMLGQRNRGKKKPAKLSAPASVVCWLSADWTRTGSGAELQLAANEVEEKVKAADIGGAAEAEKLSPEEQELLEEMQETYGRYSIGDELKPGQPVFAYMSQISEDERDAAMAEASKKVKTRAAILAKAGGLNLGAVKSISTYGTSWQQNYRHEYVRMQQLQAAFGGEDAAASHDSEAIGVSPTSVRQVVTVAFEAKE